MLGTPGGGAPGAWGTELLYKRLSNGLLPPVDSAASFATKFGFLCTDFVVVGGAGDMACFSGEWLMISNEY